MKRKKEFYSCFAAFLCFSVLFPFPHLLSLLPSFFDYCRRSRSLHIRHKKYTDTSHNKISPLNSVSIRGLLSCLSTSVFPDFPEVLVDTGIQITQSNPVNPGTPVDTPVLTGREFNGDFQHITKFWNSISLTIRDQNLAKCWK
jgi:hypothetical protein